jgi:hypothetical protein
MAAEIEGHAQGEHEKLAVDAILNELLDLGIDKLHLPLELILVSTT